MVFQCKGCSAHDVVLKFDNNSPAGTKMLAQFKVELHELEKEGKQQRLDQARKEQKLKGLQ